MKRTNYETPQIDVIEIEINDPILQTSDGYLSDVEYGGSAF